MTFLGLTPFFIKKAKCFLFGMTWKTHKLLSFSFILLITKNPLWALLGAIGSILPDKVEFVMYGKTWSYDVHRKITHWPILWLSLCCIFYLSIYQTYSYQILNAFTLNSLLNKNFWSSINFAKNLLNHRLGDFEILFFIFCFWLSVGGFLHVLQDAISGKIPLIHPFKRTFGVRLIRTKSKEEKGLFFLFLLVLLIKFFYSLGIFS